MTDPATPLPMLVSTWSFGLRGHAAAWPDLRAGGPAVDAVERVCAIIDADPEVDSVGYGGLPDAAGGMSLDGCIMLSPDRCGAVCAIHRHLNPVTIARHVMEDTVHVMLAGDGADRFADQRGIHPADLLAPEARAAWERWIRDPKTIDQSRDGDYLPPRPVDRQDAGRLFGRDVEGESHLGHHDTIGVLAIDAGGALAGACSTSGMPYKVPGRVGDSPIIGAGLYVDPVHGAAVATGTGELVMGVCGSFLAVECMRRGASPDDAVVEVQQRIMDVYEVRDEHQVGVIALRPDGPWAASALRSGFKVAITTDAGDELHDPGHVMLSE